MVSCTASATSRTARSSASVRKRSSRIATEVGVVVSSGSLPASTSLSTRATSVSVNVSNRRPLSAGNRDADPALESCSPKLHRLARLSTLTAFGVSAWLLAAGPVATILRPRRAHERLGLLTDPQPLTDVRDQVAHRTSLRFALRCAPKDAADEFADLARARRGQRDTLLASCVGGPRTRGPSPRHPAPAS